MEGLSSEFAVGWRGVPKVSIIAAGKVAWGWGRGGGGGTECVSRQHEAVGGTGFSSGMVERGTFWSHGEAHSEEAEDVVKPFASVIRW